MRNFQRLRKLKNYSCMIANFKPGAIRLHEAKFVLSTPLFNLSFTKFGRNNDFSMISTCFLPDRATHSEGMRHRLLYIPTYSSNACSCMIDDVVVDVLPLYSLFWADFCSAPTIAIVQVQTIYLGAWARRCVLCEPYK